MLAPAAWAGGQQVVAEAAKDGRSLVVRTYRCGTPASLSLSGEAEGLAGGKRRTIALEITRASEPGAFNVTRQWPDEGQWALVFTVAGEHPVSTLVTLEPGAGIRIAAQKQGYEKPSAERIVGSLLASDRSPPSGPPPPAPLHQSLRSTFGGKYQTSRPPPARRPGTSTRAAPPFLNSRRSS